MSGVARMAALPPSPPFDRPTNMITIAVITKKIVKLLNLRVFSGFLMGCGKHKGDLGGYLSPSLYA
jgi:hypothetical protein